jgi:CheY-like chemotaxis protein
MLLHYNIQTQVAQDRAEALRYLAQHSFDAFILDVRLISYEDHNADGLDIAQQIRAQDADAPVLLLSGWLAQLTQARHFAENTTNVHVADKTHPPEVEEAIKVLCTVLSTTRTSLYSA